MSQAQANHKSRIYQAAVTVAGLCIWLIAAVGLLTEYAWRDQLAILTLTPLVIFVGMFPNTFPMPSNWKFTHEKISFTLSDAFVLLIACWHGPAAAVFVAGIEGFTSSRRTVRRLSSNLFSYGMMSLAAAAAAASLNAVLRYGWHEAGASDHHTFAAAAVAVLVASIVQVILNWGLISTLIAMRHGSAILHEWRINFLCAAPLVLPTSAAASLMYFAFQYDVLASIVIGGPILAAIYFGHRQYHSGVQQRIHLVEKAHRETIEALAVAINAKDEVTHEHVLRVQIYAAGVAHILGCNKAEIEALKAGALLHDIGKIAVPDYIINKPGKLTAAEFEKMKLHTIIGAQILSRVEFPYPVVPIVRHHHERWDGKGYPDGLKAEEIPLTARILTVVDCFDAVREDRQYRKGMTRPEAIDFLLQNSGSQYDPRVVGTFITHLPEFEAEIAAHRDAPLPMFGIEPAEQLTEAARQVLPAAGLAEAVPATQADELKFSRKELTAFYELAQSLNHARDHVELASIFTEQLQQIVPYDSCALIITEPETGRHMVTHARGVDAALLEGRELALGEGVTGWVLANRKPFCNTDPRLDLPPSLADSFAAYKTLAVFPLINEEEMHGAITLYSSALSEYSLDQQRLLGEAVTVFSAALSSNSQNSLNPAQPVPQHQDTSEPASLFPDSHLKLTDAPLESQLAH
ncbi:MAG TPA: HD domain-containing phosphohydrolase [Pyrinomonadaceae bacterium]|jgi:putative nucleotidyltransferase with HDIG domain|nr:HD domain-containing phosphohydrolase [Pyrinomonadaceae bacterium]